MPFNICIYEDEKFSRFYPITLTRPVYCMRAGILPLFRRAERFFDQPRICLNARQGLAGVVAAEWRDYPVNIIKRIEGTAVLFLNGRFRDLGDLPGLIGEARISTIFRNQGEIVGLLFKPETISDIPLVATQSEYLERFRARTEEIPDFDTSATLFNNCWEIMGAIEQEIADDFAFLHPHLAAADQAVLHDGCHLIEPTSIFTGTGVEVLPGAVLDASGGPIYIGEYTRIESHAAIYGPCYIGPNSIVTAGKVTCSSIGHTCRIGGEVEESVFQAYVNKYHAGFIGHSYIGSWVNFGAMTTNSDLKNNYANIRVSLNGEVVDTGSIKVGSFVGDHSKFGIGTLLNTGITVGVCCNIFGGGLIAEKEVPSFSWGGASGFEQHRFDKAVDTARITTERRNVVFSTDDERLLYSIFDNSASADGVVSF